MILLVLDPATSTGFCLVNIGIEDGYYTTADIYEYGFIDADTSSNFQGDHCLDLMGKLQNLITEHNVEHIAIEDYFFSRKFRNGCNSNAAYRTAIHILARQNDLDYTIINISAWKTFVAGSSRPSKEQKKEWGAEAAKKLYIQQALWERYSFRFPNHSLSDAGRPILFRFDIIDVVGQAVYYCGLICGIGDIKMSVEIPEDVVFTRKVKKRFIYPVE